MSTKSREGNGDLDGILSEGRAEVVYPTYVRRRTRISASFASTSEEMPLPEWTFQSEKETRRRA